MATPNTLGSVAVHSPRSTLVAVRTMVSHGRIGCRSGVCSLAHSPRSKRGTWTTCRICKFRCLHSRRLGHIARRAEACVSAGGEEMLRLTDSEHVADLNGGWCKLLLVGGLCAALLGCGGSNDSSTSSDPIARGEQMVQSQACATCHQSDNGSDGILAGRTQPATGQKAGLKLYGPNLTPDPDTGLGNWSDEEIEQALSTGVDDEGETLCSAMPKFSNMSAAEIKDLIAYLRSLPSVHNEVPESVCE
jgi:mono/diheme cytochrome c family protein